MESEIVDRLVTELNITRLALGQIICNFERDYESVPPKRVARRWLEKAPTLSKEEWIAGAEGLIHHFNVTPSPSATEAIMLLSPSEQRHEEYVVKYRGIHWRRGRHKNAVTFELGRKILEARLGIAGDVEQQNPRCENGGIFEISPEASAWKTRFMRIGKWMSKRANATR